MVIPRIQAGRRYKQRTVQTEFSRFSIHDGRKILQTAGKIDCRCVCRVIPGGEQHACNKITQRDLIVFTQAEQRAFRIDHIPGNIYRFIQFAAFAGNEGRQYFCGGRDGALFIRVLLIQNL